MKNIFRKYPKLDGFFQFSEFNEVQKQCLPKIMDRQENIIISSPTSSGKTVLFQFAILKYCDLPNPMCLYLAPIKSLCHQKYNRWTKKFHKKLKIAELTGDNLQNNSDQYLQSHITIGTPQKVDFLSRQSLEYLKKIKLLLIDEIHMLNFEERGATLEAIVSRIMSLNKNIRIIAVSATIPNIQEVGQWLRVPKESICVFGQEYRPIKLNKIVMGFKNAKEHFTFEKSLNYKLLEAIRQYSDGKGSLIFCPTQKGTKQACQQIINQMRERQFIQNDKQLVSLIQATQQVSNASLQTMLPQGIAFHNAGLSLQDRNIIERLFLDCKIKVLCTTSTLSMGINLPAHLVIIKSTLCYRGSAKGYQQYTRIQIDQMTGRAGRPPFDTQGNVIIMTQKSNYNRYSGKLQLQDLQSQLFSQMLEHLNAEISLGSIKCLSDVEDYIKNSFCYIRMKKSPKNYGINGPLDDYISQSCKKAINSLSELKIINYNPDTGRIYAKPLSNSISKSSVYIKSIAFITKMVNQPLSQKEYLTILCQCEQINRYNSKIEEREYLKRLNQKNKYAYKAKEAIANAQKKCFVLIQSQLSKITIENWELRRQASDIMICLKRLNYCVKTLALQLKVFWIYYWSMSFIKYFNLKFWDQAGVKIVSQFTGLQDKQKYLSTQGIKSITDLKNNLQSLENWLQKGPKFTAIIQQQILHYETCLELSLSHDKNSNLFYLKITLKNSSVGKLKGINICIGDSKNNLYYYKYIDHANIELSINFAKNQDMSYKVGLIKEGIIGFDQFYVIQNGNLIRKNIQSLNQPEGKVVKNRKSVENMKSFKKNQEATDKKSKSFDNTDNKRQKFAKTILNKFNKDKKTQQNHDFHEEYDIDKLEMNQQTTDKKEIQLKLPSNYRVNKPLARNPSQQQQLLEKKIKKDSQFRYKPLHQYNWKPGFEEIPSQSQEQTKINKKLRLVQSKEKQHFISNKNITNFYQNTLIKRPENVQNYHPNPKKPSKQKQQPSIIKFDIPNNAKKKNLAPQKFNPQKKQAKKQDVFNYFYNLF